MPEKITSTQNPRIRNLLLLQGKSRERKAQNRIVIEGFREVQRAILSGFEILELYYCPDLDFHQRIGEIASASSSIVIIEVSPGVFEKIAYREGSDGMIALATPRLMTLDTLKLSDNPLIIILEAVEKPGNLGAIMRTADAAGLDAVIVCDPLTDIFNPNIIRSSLGCIFTVPVAVSGSDEVIRWLKSNMITAYAAALSAKDDFYDKDFRRGTAFIMGTEAEGLSEKWLNNASEHIRIPMRGVADSLNVSVSAAILVFEAVRQRQS